MKRAAQGDYTPDAAASRFPMIKAGRSSATMTLASLFDHWRAETKPEGSTVTTWRAVVTSLRTHTGDGSTTRLTASDIISWKDKLVAQGRAAKTINDTYLACLRALLSHGIRNGWLSKNVAVGVRVKDKRRAGINKLPYDDAEVALLLGLAAKEEQPARRWIPLLAACSGARAGELAQLWAERVREVDGVMVMELRPAEDGGGLKNEGSERTVPLPAPRPHPGGIPRLRASEEARPLVLRPHDWAGERHHQRARSITLPVGFASSRASTIHAKSRTTRYGIGGRAQRRGPQFPTVARLSFKGTRRRGMQPSIGISIQKRLPPT